MVIYGLKSAEISSTEMYLRNCAQSKLEVESQIQLSRYESLFLRKRYNASLKEFCSVCFPTASDFQDNSAYLVLRGSKAKVELARQRINEAISDLKVCEIKFRHDCYGEMWKRKWSEVKAQQEILYDVLVNVYMIVDKKDASYKTPADIGGTVELAVVGKDDNVVSKVEEFINDTGATLLRETETATRGQLKAILEGLQSKKLRLREDHNTEVVLDWEKQTFEFITPNGSRENLDAAHSSLMAYIQGVVIHKETVVTNNCGLAVLLQQKSKNFWQQIVSIAKQHAVTVKLIGNGIDIRGKLDDIAKTKVSIKVKLQEYLKQIKKRKVLVDILMSPILNTPIFESIVAKFKQEYGVVVSYAKCSAIYSIEVVKTPNDSCFTIDICVGNVLTEISDAIVNVTDCNLQHTEGLAKEMVNAGGSIIQNRSDDYVKTHGTLDPCEAVCLDSGDLKCGKIIHCVPPVWVDGQRGEAKDVNKTVTNCLLRAEECLTGTILIPSFPCEECSISEYAEASLKAVLDLCNSGSLKFLYSVRFVIPTLEVAKEFERQLKLLEPNRSKCIQRRLKAEVNWKYENDQGQMDSYTEKQSQAIESIWQSKTPSEIQIGQWKYTFNFDSNPMKQINKTTNRSRTILRTNCETSNTTAMTEVDDQVEIVLVGSEEGLVKAGNEIEKFFESSVVPVEIPLSTGLSRDVVDSICKKYKVKIADFSSSKVVLKGLESNVTKATLEIKDILLRDYSNAESYPDEWEPQNEEPLELKPLTRTSPEWSKVSQKFLATMPSTNVVKIERIQNKWLWEKYSQHSERMKRKNKGVINEMLLFHGTCNTPPSCIYQDEEGFDMRFSNAGMWGNGNYFAVNASYSHSYAHPLSDGTRQMFLAKVLTGYSIQQASNRSLRMPPVRQHSAKGGDMKYDTVSGVTGGSQVFITYSNDKAYPFYLISYK